MKKLLNIKNFGSPHETADVFEKKLLKCGCKKIIARQINVLAIKIINSMTPLAVI